MYRCASTTILCAASDTIGALGGKEEEEEEEEEEENKCVVWTVASKAIFSPPPLPRSPQQGRIPFSLERLFPSSVVPACLALKTR
jgi:hypothetical protein